MAQDLLFVGGDLSSSDLDGEDNERTKITQKAQTTNPNDDTDSLSSDEDGVPLIKKKRSTTRRGISAVKNNARYHDRDLESSEEEDFYSSRVSKVLGSMRTAPGQLPTALSLTVKSDSDDEEDDEEDDHDLFSKKPAGQRSLRKTSSKAATKTRAKTGRGRRMAAGCSNVTTTSTKNFAPYKESVIDLDSDSCSEDKDKENEGTSSLLDASRNSETTPAEPPTPPSPPRACGLPINKRKKPRQQKALKDAYKELERAVVMQKGRDADADDNDVSIVDVFSPPSDRLQAKQIVLKVQSRSGIQRFTVKSTDPFTGIIQSMASHEFVPVDRIVMFLGDQTIEPYDSPRSLNLTVADIIECHILRPGETADSSRLDESLDDPDVIRVKVQSKNARSRTTVTVRKNEGLGKLMQKYATSQNVGVDKLRFEFDGDEITAMDTADDLGLEDNFCIDVITI